jgi:two-component system, LuxR family, sensor kinase FixL
MSWLTTAWLVLASACGTLVLIHGLVWFRQRNAAGVANGAFAVLAASVAAVAINELHLFRADTIEEFGRLLWWYHIPIWSGVVSIVVFVRVYMKAGRAWLGWTVIGLRSLGLVINFFSSPNINYREIAVLEKIDFFGEMVTVVQGTTNPWLLVPQLSLLVLIVFLADAVWTAARRPDRRSALTIGSSLVLFVSAGTALAVISYWGIARIPPFVSLFFLPIVLAMGFELGLDLIRAAQLSEELRVKEIALRDSEQKLAFAADAANAGLWSIDGTTGRMWATARALSMFGLRPGREHRFEEVLDSIHPDDRSRVRAFVQTAGGQDRVGFIEYRVVSPSGEVHWYASRGGPHGKVGDGPQGLMGATIDITERRRVEDETARQRIELEHLSRVATLSELSGALAHELNQPLAIIMSNAEAAQRLLERPEPDLEEIRAILTDIVDADERAGEVIKRLRSMLKRGSPNRQPLSLNQLVLTVLQFMRGDLVRRGVEVETSLDESLQPVNADAVPIEQVLINVITNAGDAMAANAPGDRTLRISTFVDASMACVKVADCGCGLPVSPERVFDAFYTTKADGLGMGLAISRSIVASHGGRLFAEANDGRGTAFTVCLPLTSEGV